MLVMGIGWIGNSELINVSVNAMSLYVWHCGGLCAPSLLTACIELVLCYKECFLILIDYVQESDLCVYVSPCQNEVAF